MGYACALWVSCTPVFVFTLRAPEIFTAPAHRFKIFILTPGRHTIVSRRARRGFVGHELKWRPTATLPPMAMLPPTATPEVECFDWSSYQTHMAHTESLICQRPMCSFMQAISLGSLEERTLRIVSASCPSHMNLMHPTPAHTHFRIPPLLSQSSSQRMAWHTQLRPSSRCHGQS